MINISRTDLSNPIGTCEAVLPIRQGVILNLVFVNLELFNATARGSQELFPHELLTMFSVRKPFTCLKTGQFPIVIH
jgi:hypothetical protein